jgi:hypothetical protein
VDQGCLTLSTVAPLELYIEAAQSSGISVLAEVADLVAAQYVVSEAAQPGEDAGVTADARLILLEGNVARLVPPIFDMPMAANPMGVPPALPGRQSEFDVCGGSPRLSIDETPPREPPKHTNWELHRWTSWRA